MYRHISRLHLKQQLNSDFVCTVTSEYTEIVSLPEYIHKYIHNVEASFLLGGLEVAWHSSSRTASFFFFWFAETIFQRATNGASLSFSTQILQSLKLSQPFFPIRSAAHSVFQPFPCRLPGCKW